MQEGKKRHTDVFASPRGISFDLNTSYCVYSVIEKKTWFDARGAAFRIEVD